MYNWQCETVRAALFGLAMVGVSACGGSETARQSAAHEEPEPLYWIPSTVPAIAQLDVSRLRRSSHYPRLVELWKSTPYFDAKLLALVEKTEIAYVGMRDIDAGPDSEFYVVARGEFEAASAISAVNAMLQSGVLGSAAMKARLEPDTQGGWSANYGRVRDDGKNTAHLEKLSARVWALSVSFGPVIRADTKPAPPSVTHLRLMNEANFSDHVLAFVADTEQLPGDFASTSLTLDIEDAALASSRQKAKAGVSPDAHAERLQSQLSQFSMAAALAGFGSLEDMITIRASGDTLKIDARVPPDLVAKALDMAQSFAVPR